MRFQQDMLKSQVHTAYDSAVKTFVTDGSHSATTQSIQTKSDPTTSPDFESLVNDRVKLEK